MNVYIQALILGSIVGFIGGLQGAVGSIYIVFGLMILGISKSHRHAAGTTLFYTAFPFTALASYEYYKRGYVDVGVGLVLLISGAIFSILGAKMNFVMSPKITYYIIGITTLIIGLYYIKNAVGM